MGLLDFLFPKRCVNCRAFGSYLCATCFTYLSYEPERICLMCNRSSWNSLTHPGCLRKQGIDGSFSVLSYNQIVKRLLFTYKYQPYVSDLKQLIGELLYEGIIQNEHCMHRLTGEVLFMPIPLHLTKQRKRGYNHALLLAQGLGEKIDTPVLDILLRTRHTTSQFLLKKEDRQQNVKDAFALKKGSEEGIKGKTIFLIDDVTTTGSTLKEAAKVLKRNGVREVYGLTLAHGQ